MNQQLAQCTRITLYKNLVYKNVEAQILEKIRTFLFVVGKIMYHIRVLGKYFVQYEKGSDLIGSEEIDNVEDQLL